ncbi:cbb3-type cytochrome c oxidase subunit III [Nitrospirillum amazonense]|uniref:Cbb3-type cytochrome c oxidase subunit III n=1 Tax=Nitrospirillum amazonense TaxID=28077 RepID=A0A560JQK0_9PROT|nr:cytochrome c [Nitrospirillum amazonense]TWB73375.1 cbb3-type cytochrome c oxidase subunit III [Nitrospirillum amazonense]
MTIFKSFTIKAAGLTALLTGLYGAAGALPHPAHAQASDASSAAFASPRHFGQKDGAALYQAICQGCHMPDAKGATGAGTYPALAGNPNLEAAGYPVAMVVHGQKAMPPIGEFLDDDQVAAVVNYVRTHFGNHYTDAVTAADVKAAR